MGGTATTTSPPPASSKPAGPSLQKMWDLKDPAPLGSGTNDKAKKFLEDFKAAMVNVNDCLQSTKINAEKAKHEAMVGKRDQIYGEVPGKLAEINKDEAKADAVSKPFLDRARALSGEAHTLRIATDKSYSAWRAKETAYNTAVGQIEQLENWDTDGKYKPLRKSSDDIRSTTNENKFDEAVKMFDQLQAKLKPEWAEFEKVKPGLDKIDRAKLKFPIKDSNDLKKVLQDLESTKTDVKAALMAYQQMSLDSLRPPKAPKGGAGKKQVLSDEAKQKLNQAKLFLNSQQTAMTATIRNMQAKEREIASIRDNQKEGLLKELPPEFWRDLDAKHSEVLAALTTYLKLAIKVGFSVEHLAELALEEGAEHLNEAAQGHPKDLTPQVTKLGEALNGLVKHVKEGEQKRIKDGLAGLLADAKTLADNMKNYEDGYKNYSKTVDLLVKALKDNLSAEVAAILKSATQAIMSSKTARAMLEGTSLKEEKCKEYGDLLKPPLGTLIFVGPEAGQGLGRNMVVYQKGSEQNCYNVPRGPLENGLPLLEHVNFLYKSAADLEKLHKEWDEWMQALVG